MARSVQSYRWWLLYLTERRCIAPVLSIRIEWHYAIAQECWKTEDCMQKIIIAFILGLLLGFALALFLTKDEMPLYTDPSMMEEANKHLDGSTHAIQEGRKNLLP